MNSRLMTAVAVLAGLAGSAAMAQQQQPQFPDMTFFVTSKPGPDGANFGGLEGADKHCQTLATAAGAGAKTWRAYLSKQGAGAVNARDRIGAGPWQNVKGVVIATSVDDLHANPKLDLDNSLTETGRKIAGFGFNNNNHDILTGSDPQGRALPADKDATCGNYTKNGDGAVMFGHSDRKGTSPPPTDISWNSAHLSIGCSPALMARTGGGGLLYCFAAK